MALVVAGAGLVAGLGLFGLDRLTPAPRLPAADPAVPTQGFRLVAFDSCDDALARLKSAARDLVGPFGFDDFTGVTAVAEGGPPNANRGMAAPQDATAPAQGGAGYSGTNTHEAGVEEPDLVKTDGRRIVTVGPDGVGEGTVLRVTNVTTQAVTGELVLRDLPTGSADLLLHDDRVLLLTRYDRGGGRAIRGDGVLDLGPDGQFGTELRLIELVGKPHEVSRYRVDGTLVDARQVGAMARVVVRSAPRLDFPSLADTSDDKRLEANRAVIDAATAEQWFPGYEVTGPSGTRTGMVPCDHISRPAQYSGTSMATVLSFDLGREELSDGDAVTVVADGDTVYGNGRNLYLTNDRRWQLIRVDGSTRPEDERTEIYKFDTSGTAPPRFVAAGEVPGWLINQYALSEWDDHLRIATTTGNGQDPANAASSSSTVYVLRQRDNSLVEAGRVGGLGKGERIYAVRFLGPSGYVVTFRQTDPLYTVDLSDPTAPAVTGELKVTGYSSYLHPVGAGRLLGVGQEASTAGRILGTQVSLFDVSDVRRPDRLAQHHLPREFSEAETDPHAFLYWPDDQLMVLPVAGKGEVDAASRALVLRVADTGFTAVGEIEHAGANGTIRRSLVTGNTLWTVSGAGLKATNISTMDTLAWLPA